MILELKEDLKHVILSIILSRESRELRKLRESNVKNRGNLITVETKPWPERSIIKRYFLE